MITAGSINGHRALWLENDLLRVAVLPEKGADICELLYKPTATDFLLQTPAGLRPPGPHPAAGFLENYEGGWQELFPNINDSCRHREVEVPFHGEVALLPWQWAIERDDPDEGALALSVRCRRMPLRLTKVLRLRRSEAILYVEEVVTNEADDPADLVWGHHLVLGGGFLEGGCLLEVDAERIFTPEELYEPATARLAAGQRECWPFARGRHGERVDLRQIPGPEAHAHDDVILGSLRRGYAAVTNPRLGLRFALEWDGRLFRYVGLWQPLGGADAPPLTGIYGLGLEPWSSRYNLARAVEHGEAITLGPGQALHTTLMARVDRAGPNSLAGM
ncbi:MAG: aldose 1-epimerase family protein [Anaerolineae bacterium]|nr:aldose 1-epimerase family protein [Anaerolineae bacterium]